MTNRRIETLTCGLKRRLRVLAARRDHYRQRLQYLAEARLRSAISRTEWLAATERLTEHLLRVEDELAMVSSELDSLPTSERR